MSTTTTTTAPPNPLQPDALSPTNWTTAQELTLLRSLVHTKPIGIHKNFRILSIHSALLSSNTIPHPISSHPHASTIPGLWRKLESLYDLKALDEREDSGIVDDDSDEDGEAEGDDEERKGKEEYWRDFELSGHDGGDGEFERMMWERRLADGGDEDWSDDGDGTKQDRERESTTVGDSEEPETELRSSPPIDAGSARGTRSSGRRALAGRRVTEVKVEGTGTGMASGRAASRRTSKAATITTATATSSVDGDDTEMQDAETAAEGDEAVGSGEENGDDESEDESGTEETTEDDRRGSSGRVVGRGRGGARRGRGGRRGRRGK